MRRWHYYRLPVILYIVAAFAAQYETSQVAEDVEEAQLKATRTLTRRYPDLPQHQYIRGMMALEKQEYREAIRLFDEAVENRFFNNESLLHTRARLLDYLGESPATVEEAAELWKKHFPHSENPDPRDYK